MAGRLRRWLHNGRSMNAGACATAHPCRGRTTPVKLAACRIVIIYIYAGRIARRWSWCAVAYPGRLRSAPGGLCLLAVPDEWALWGRLSRFVLLVGLFAEYSPIARAPLPHNAGFAFLRNFFLFQGWCSIMEQARAASMQAQEQRVLTRRGIWIILKKGGATF